VGTVTVNHSAIDDDAAGMTAARRPGGVGHRSDALRAGYRAASPTCTTTTLMLSEPPASAASRTSCSASAW
jgi:hypothetical protein